MSTRRKVKAIVLAFATTACLLLNLPPEAIPRASADQSAIRLAANDSASAEILVMHATQISGAGSIDPKIGTMPQLQKPPFSAYNTYKLVDKKTLPLAKGTPATYPMVNGRTLQVTLLDVTSDNRFHVTTAINQPGGEAYLKLLEVTASPNEPFFVGGQTYQGGSLVLALTMKPKP